MATYTYESALATAQRVNWKIGDIIGGDKRLDFTKPFMPESLAGIKKLDFLSPDEQRTLNQIRGLGYWSLASRGSPTRPRSSSQVRLPPVGQRPCPGSLQPPLGRWTRTPGLRRAITAATRLREVEHRG